MRALKTKGVGHVHQLLFNNYASNPTIFARRKSCEGKALSSDTDKKKYKKLLKPEPATKAKDLPTGYLAIPGWNPNFHHPQPPPMNSVVAVIMQSSSSTSKTPLKKKTQRFFYCTSGTLGVCGGTGAWILVGCSVGQFFSHRGAGVRLSHVRCLSDGFSDIKICRCPNAAMNCYRYDMN